MPDNFNEINKSRPSLETCSKGGQASAIVQRSRALERYYKNPLKCMFCKGIIEPAEHEQVADLKGRRFCSLSCASSYRWKFMKEHPEAREKLGWPVPSIEASSKGGRIRAVHQREAALARYYANPCYCIHCGSVIQVRENGQGSEIRLQNRKFCSRACVLKHRWAEYREAGIPIQVARPTFVDKLLHREKITVTRQQIQVHATRVYKKLFPSPACEICGYSFYVEIAHVDPVCDFHNSAELAEINSIGNLIGLCPNHHKEFDRGKISRQEIRQRVVDRIMKTRPATQMPKGTL